MKVKFISAVRDFEMYEKCIRGNPHCAGGGLLPMPEEAPTDRQATLDNPKLNDILGAIPGATVSDIK